MISLAPTKQTLVVIGNGMVGNRFLEKLVGLDGHHKYRVVVFGEEPQAAYDRVHLSDYFAGKTQADLTLSPLEWYGEHGIELRLGDRVTEIDTASKTLRSSEGLPLRYDFLVLATGSAPFVPPVPGIDREGVFVYRTLLDLDGILAYAPRAKAAAVIGGGLLGLEAARALRELGLKTSIVEFAPRLMPRQLDDDGAGVLKTRIEAMEIEVLTNRRTSAIEGDPAVTGLTFEGDPSLEVEMVVVSAGIRPRDELAKKAGIQLAERGGVTVDDHMRTSAPHVFAIGEVAAHQGITYGLVAPGYAMAEVVAKELMDESAVFEPGSLSTKLKLLGVDVASFGDAFGADVNSRTLSFQDTAGGIYKRINISPKDNRILGGMLVGDTEDYGLLLHQVLEGSPLPENPESLLLGSRGASTPLLEMILPDSAQVCSCENVSKGAVCKAIAENSCQTLEELKSATPAGSGCGGCVPTLTQILKQELAAAGTHVPDYLCEHFAYSRQDLFKIVQVKGLRSFEDILKSHGEGDGCEVCKPTIASILASLWNAPVFNHATIQDTNDRYMANIQRGGTYSVIPRVPGGEISADQLITLGEVAKKYTLYTKITGGQRVVLFGARLDQLPPIWEELVEAGFESGHAYGKALRTIKSCVGDTWCRYGVRDSIGLAIRLEHRYKGIRAPHKIKSAVSGCIRECAEAQTKDFGVIATDGGWNLYVGGNGGARPRHAELLASDLDEETLVKLIDRFLMYYIHTADKLQRTARWIEEMEGGLKRLREVVVDDVLGIGEDLEDQMETLVGSYICEWKALLQSPERKKAFTHFINTPQPDPTLAFINERGHQRPADWSTGDTPLELVKAPDSASGQWWKAGAVEDIPTEGGACVRKGDRQLAVFHFASRGEWYATDNLCPHKQEMVLSRGLLGSDGDVPKVACPLHKKTFSLKDGECLNGDLPALETYPVRVSEGEVFIFLPDETETSQPKTRLPILNEAHVSTR